MNVEILIRIASDRDYEALLPFFAELDTLHRQHHPERFRESDGPPRTPEYFHAILADDRQCIFVAEAHSSLAGFAHVILKDAPPLAIVVPRSYALIDAIVVTARYQGHGVGGQLMAQAEAWATAMGAAAIELGVYEFNRAAQDFYAGLGYTTYYRRMTKSLPKPEHADVERP